MNAELKTAERGSAPASGPVLDAGDGSGLSDSCLKLAQALTDATCLLLKVTHSAYNSRRQVRLSPRQNDLEPMHTLVKARQEIFTLDCTQPIWCWTMRSYRNTRSRALVPESLGSMLSRGLECLALRSCKSYCGCVKVTDRHQLTQLSSERQKLRVVCADYLSLHLSPKWGRGCSRTC